MGNVSFARALFGLAVALTLGACGGGGGGNSATVSFAFQNGTQSVGESDGPTDVTVVLKTLVPALTTDATVEVFDLGDGTASSSLDYAPFATQMVTFPAGSVDGATQVVTLDPQDDAFVDAPNQTIRLGLQNPVGGILYGTTQLTATIADVDSALVTFATTGEGSPEANTLESIALELDCDPGVTLETAVSVRVSDLHTGTAVPPADYNSFTAQTVTFPAGSGDGAVQTVDIQVKQDATTEADETVELGLASPSPGCNLGPIATHVFTIVDDDALGNAAFVPSEGATGTENGLAYDELISLGSQTVGAGGNAGTLLRVANGGGQPMDLGAPRIAGSHPNDFAVDIESSSFTAPLVPAASAAALPAVAVPLAALPQDAGPGVALRLDPAEIARLQPLATATLSQIVLPELGPVTLELRRRPLPLTDDAKLVIDGQEVAGGVRTLLGDLQIWSGSVVGMEGSRVFLAFTGPSAQGFFELPDTSQRFVHVLADGPGQVRLMTEPALAALGFEPPAEVCAGERFVPGTSNLDAPEPPATGALTFRNCRLALETDFQLYQKFNSSVLLTNYVTSQIAAISDQYVTDVQSTLSIAYLGVHTNVNDGWSAPENGNNAGDLLDEFQNAWTSNRPVGSDADLAHFLSGANLGGGVAYVDVLCNQSFGFGVSANLTGNINWLTWTGQPAGFTWDFVVVAHEIGHNFGAQHTHDYCPPLDKCTTNCTGTTACSRGTLMSYCHLCGGLANIDLYFHPVSANIMRVNANTSCLDPAALLPGDFVQYHVRFNPLTTTGARSASLEFTHNAPNATHPFRVQLAGTAN